jgi:mannose-6-phosphate isomerase
VFADPHAKPELLVALTPFEALCGVRPEARTIELLRAITADDLADVVEAEGAGVAMERLYRGDLDAASAVKACAASDRPEARWVQRLDTMYPGDPSVAVTLLLNHVSLLPGEALHLTAGNLHGYLRGSGIELMQASDNVVRGGLTVKHVDIDLLLNVVDSTPLVEPVMRVINGRYRLPEAEVQLISLNTGEHHTSTGHELALSVTGDQLYLAPNTQFVASADTFVVTSI